MLEKNVGKDISKFFHGGYSLEPLQGAKPHTHSNYARTIVNSLIVARYVTKRDKALMSVKSKTAILVSDEQNLDYPVQSFRLQVGFQAINEGAPKIRNFYPDLDMVGRHYVVQE